ncbi:hypothetical protein ACFO9Q_21035 [Paenibacillus sp. GCM10023252]|uniref:hypothetical protein n=1 Tax=Paenibacillus sp. GCM10023252 TaxID=3252649 RepID=UPI0036185A01
MMTVRKWGSITAATVVFASLLAGCSGNTGTNNEEKGNNASATPEPTATATATATAEAYKPFAKPVKATIQMRTWGTVAPENNELEVELEKKINTDLTMQFVPFDQYVDRVNVQLASKNLPDAMEVILGDNVNFPIQTYNAIKGGAFYDLTPIIESADFATKYPELAKIPKEYWNYMKVNGKIYGVPKGLVYNPYFRGSMRIREDLLKSLNLQAPTTAEELSSLLVKMTNPPERYGLNFDQNNFNTTNTAPMIAAFTGAYSPWKIDDKGDFIYRDFMPEYKDFLGWIQNLVKQKAINPEFALAQPTSFIKKGKSGVILGDMYDWIHLPDVGIKFFEDGVKDAKLNVYEPVKGPKGYAIMASKPFDAAWIINAKAGQEGAERILEIANYTATAEYAAFAKNPIEGVYYTVVDGKKVETQKYKDEGVWIYQNLMGAYAATPWQFDADKNFGDASYTARVQEIEAAVKKIAEAEKVEYTTVGLSAPTYDEKWKALTKDLDANAIKVAMSAMSFEDWDKYVSTLVNDPIYKQIQKEFKEAKAAQK